MRITEPRLRPYSRLSQRLNITRLSVERWALRVLKIRLNDELGERFLKVVARVYGPGEAQIERAAEEAIRTFLQRT